LELANSLISGTSTKEKVTAWKNKYFAAFQANGKKKLRKGYWQEIYKAKSQ
jgi:hypothetical protein